MAPVRSSLYKNLLETLAAVGGAEDAALGVRPVRMAQHGHEEAVGIAGSTRIAGICWPSGNHRRQRSRRLRRPSDQRSHRHLSHYAFPRWGSGRTSGPPNGRRNIWGTVPTVVEMQSEGGAAGALHGALQGGALDHHLHRVAGPAADDPQHVQDRRAS
jgi:hypothetical protein